MNKMLLKVIIPLFFLVLSGLLIFILGLGDFFRPVIIFLILLPGVFISIFIVKKKLIFPEERNKRLERKKAGCFFLKPRTTPLFPRFSPEQTNVIILPENKNSGLYKPADEQWGLRIRLSVENKNWTPVKILDIHGISFLESRKSLPLLESSNGFNNIGDLSPFRSGKPTVRGQVIGSHEEKILDFTLVLKSPSKNILNFNLVFSFFVDFRIEQPRKICQIRMAIPAMFIFQTADGYGYLFPVTPFSLKEYYKKKVPLQDFIAEAEKAAREHIGTAYIFEEYANTAPLSTQKEIKYQIEAILSARKISPCQRDIIILHFIDGKNLKDIAGLKHIKSSTASVNKKLALEKIRTLFDYEIQNYYKAREGERYKGVQYLREEHVNDFLLKFVQNQNK